LRPRLSLGAPVATILPFIVLRPHFHSSARIELIYILDEKGQGLALLAAGGFFVALRRPFGVPLGGAKIEEEERQPARPLTWIGGQLMVSVAGRPRQGEAPICQRQIPLGRGPICGLSSATKGGFGFGALFLAK